MNLDQAKRVIDDGEIIIENGEPIKLIDAVMYLKNLREKRKEVPGGFELGAIWKPVVSIIVPVYNNWQVTYFCIQSIIDKTKDCHFEVIIADDCSPEPDPKYFEPYYPLVKTIRNKFNLGYLQTNNNAAKHAKGKYICLLNNDTQVTEGWLKAMVDLMESDKKIGVVGAKLIYPNGKVQEAGSILFRKNAAINYGGFDPKQPNVNYVKEVDYVSGACMLISKYLWDEIGGFDEDYEGAYCEDSDFCFTVRSIGYKVVYQPKAEIYHIGGQSYHDKPKAKEAWGRNVVRLNKKWEKELSRHNEPMADIFHARDRTIGKKTILILCVGQHDYIPKFQAKGLNVKVILWFRDAGYEDKLQQSGIETLFHDDPYTKEWLKEYGSKIDCVLVPTKANVGVIADYVGCEIFYADENIVDYLLR